MPQSSSPTLLESNRWLRAFLEELLAQHRGVRQAYLFGSRVRGTARPDSDWDILVYGGWDNALHLMCELARAQGDVDLNTGGQLVDLYVESDGPTLIGVWSAEVPRVLPSEIKRWQEGKDFVLLCGDPTAPQLGARARWEAEYS